MYKNVVCILAYNIPLQLRNTLQSVEAQDYDFSDTLFWLVSNSSEDRPELWEFPDQFKDDLRWGVRTRDVVLEFGELTPLNLIYEEIEPTPWMSLAPLLNHVLYSDESMNAPVFTSYCGDTMFFAKNVWAKLLGRHILGENWISAEIYKVERESPLFGRGVSFWDYWNNARENRAELGFKGNVSDSAISVYTSDTLRDLGGFDEELEGGIGHLTDMSFRLRWAEVDRVRIPVWAVHQWHQVGWVTHNTPQKIKKADEYIYDKRDKGDLWAKGHIHPLNVIFRKEWIK